MEINGPYVVVSEEFWTILRAKISRLNADLIPEMDQAAVLIELDNHHNAIICPYCNVHITQVNN